MTSVNFSTNASIVVQLLTGIIGLDGLFINLSENNKILKQILTL